MDSAGKDGVTLRQHLKQAGRVVKDPIVPPDGGHVFEWFMTLSRARSSNGFGVNPISFLEISAWSGLFGIRPSPVELRMISAMDAAFCQAIAEQAGKG